MVFSGGFSQIDRVVRGVSPLRDIRGNAVGVCVVHTHGTVLDELL